MKVAEVASKETAEFPIFLDYSDEQYAAVEQWVGDKLAKALLTEGKLARERGSRPGQGRYARSALRAVPRG